MFITFSPKLDQPFIVPEVGDEIFATSRDDYPVIVLAVQVHFDEDDNPIRALIEAQ